MNAAAAIREDVRRLNSPGPIAQAFLQSRAFVSFIIGPVGSGKTLTALRKLRRVAQRQHGRVDEQGRTWRKGRVGVIRESYPNIDKNTLPSWFRMHPETDGKFNWRAPYTHQLRLIQQDDEMGRAKDIVDVEVEFRAIGDKSVEEACRGWELNAVLIDEADLQPHELLAYLAGRVGRFSDLDPALVVDPQIICSLNAPYTENWTYRLAIEKDFGDVLTPELVEALKGRPLIETFVQPGGREPGAENLHNLPNGRGYYFIQAALNRHVPGYVDRMIDNKPVPMQHGQPVNPNFRYDVHVRQLDYDARRPLILGVDQGLFAAAVALQRTVMGQVRTLREAVIFREEGVTLQKTGPTAFGQRARQMLNDHFPNVKPDMLRVRCDPAAFAASDRGDNEHDWILAFQKALGYKVRRAKSNRQSLRLEAIHKAMAERDGYAIDPACKHLIRAHLGGYHYRKAEVTGGELRGHLEIADTIYTHVADAEQYAALEGENVIAEIRGSGRRGGRAVTNDADYSILGD